MYEGHYGLSGRPFQLTPDPRFWFDTATHKKAMAYLGYGLNQGEGFIIVTGDIGAGKTTLVGHLTDTIDRQRLNIIKIVSTQIAAEDLLRTVCAGLGVDAAGLSKAAMLGAIEKGLHAVARSARRTLLIVDEAQALPTDSLEELRMLSNFQAAGHAMLQIVLLGQPEFRDHLRHPSLEQLRQRVVATHHLGPMDADEVAPYMLHRLSVVGWDGRPRFSDEAIAQIHGWSRGIPRRVNRLAGRVLLFGAIEGIEDFTDADVMHVIADLDAEVSAPASAPQAVVEWPIPSEPEAAAPADDVATGRPIAAVTTPPPADPRPIFADAPPPPPSAPITEPVQPDGVTELAASIGLGGLVERSDPIAPEATETPDTGGDPLDPLELAVALRPAVEAAADPGAEPVACAEPRDDAEIEAETAPAPAPADEAIHRLAAIERRLEDQDVALRRVLTLLVDWVEGAGPRPSVAGLRDAAG